PDSAYDGGVVEISHNGGAWTTLPMAYTHTVRATAGGGNPYTGPFPANTPLFSGSIGWTEVSADLSTFVGDIQLRFRFGSDAAGSDIGWFLDDVQIIGLPTGSLPQIDIALTYVSGSPVPVGGGNLIFDVFVENVDVTPLDFDAWIETAYEGGAPTTLVMRTFTDYQVGWQINRPGMFIPIPAAYAAGNYTLTGKVGVHPGVAWNESGFPYVKSGADHLSNFVPFEIVGNFPNPFGGEVTTADQIAAPDQFVMHGNYPNPFNPTTNFSFAIPQADHVTLKVFNLQGQLVETLVDGLRDAGSHNVTFDASALSSGIYLYQLTAGSNIASGKMVLVK
ncbi:MAG: T9SS type A sorting domain-containing protein, partial [bacterium]